MDTQKLVSLRVLVNAPRDGPLFEVGGGLPATSPILAGPGELDQICGRCARIHITVDVREHHAADLDALNLDQRNAAAGGGIGGRMAVDDNRGLDLLDG